MENENPMAYCINQQFQITYKYPVTFTRNAFDKVNPTLVQLLRDLGLANSRIFPVIDENVAKHHPDSWHNLNKYCKHFDVGEVLPAYIFLGGEAAKQTDEHISEVYKKVVEHAIDRHSVVLVIGGGAVLDAVGYAAATAHRGIHLIRMPSTVLAQNDAGVGVKNGINFQGRKNFVGTFAPPVAVLNDYSLLNSLSSRDKRAGIAEAIKVALIRDRKFFNELFSQRHQLSCFEDKPMQTMISRCAELHLQHIATSGDPFEKGSSRPLDFGHWAAHKLEELSHYRLRHGEAVAIGIALDSLYSQRSGLLSESDLQKIMVLITDLGFDFADNAMSDLNVEQALEEFREHLGGNLCITLLSGIGKSIEVVKIDAELMQTCLDELCSKSKLQQLTQAVS